MQALSARAAFASVDTINDDLSNLFSTLSRNLHPDKFAGSPNRAFLAGGTARVTEATQILGASRAWFKSVKKDLVDFVIAYSKWSPDDDLPPPIWAPYLPDSPATTDCHF